MKRHTALLCLAVIALAGPVSAERLLLPETLDADFTNTSQLDVMRFGAETENLAGVNFIYSGTGVPGGTTGLGFGFDNINLTGGSPPTGPFALTENAPGVSLALNLAFTGDNTVRTQTGTTAGTDAAVFNTVANQMFYVGGGDHPNPAMTFSGLPANRDVFVQIIGGDSGWNGDLAVNANAVLIDDWDTVANSSGTTSSLFAFETTTDGSGDLSLDFSISSGNFAGISGLLISGAPTPPVPLAPEPLSFLTFAIALLATLSFHFWRRRRASR